MGRADQLHRLSGICRDHAGNLFLAMEAVQRFGIGALQIISPLCPRMTRPDVGYSLGDLLDIDARFHHFGTVHGFFGRPAIRLSLHPDQFGG
jgi:UV DNA damage repair endonuclease